MMEIKLAQELSHINDWIFDLDNTLYPPSCNLFAQIDKKMGEFISNNLDLDTADAKSLQKNYFLEYGTTLNGLMVNHNINPADFLDYVHDIDVSVLPDATELHDVLMALPGRKLIYTNGPFSHADRILKHLNIDHHFEEVFDIIDSDYLPKPDMRAYQKFITSHDVDPTRAIFFEDMARNLAPASEMGMKTVWIPGNEQWSHDGSDGGHIDYVTEDLVGWLQLVSSGLKAL